MLSGLAVAGVLIKFGGVFSSIDTDTTKTLTTSDAYYDDGVWTDTLTNINAAEIGGVKSGGAGGQSMQIEDCWLMVDYLVAAILGNSTRLAMMGIGM